MTPRNETGRRTRSFIICLFSAALLPMLATTFVFAGDDDKPADIEKLQKQLRQEYRAGNYETALKTAEKIHELQPDEVESMYNLACLSCLVGKSDKAYEWLEKSIDAGYRDADDLIEDSDFRTLRGEDRFRALVRRVREAAAPTKEAKSQTSDPRKKDPPSPTKKTAQPKPARNEEAKAEPKKTMKKLSPEEAAEKVGELTQELIEVSSAGEQDKALKIAMEAYGIAKDTGNRNMVALTAYNAACMNSIKKNTDEAFKYLEEALDAGGGFAPDMVAQMEGDSDLDNIRKDARYKKMLEKAKTVRPPARSGGRQRGASDQKIGFRYEVTTPKNHNKNKAAPLIVALHGFGGTAADEKDTWRTAASNVGAVLLTPQGTNQRGSAYNWGDNLDEIEENIMSAIDDVMDNQKIDKEKIVIAGFSQGGWAAYSLALRNPDTFHGVIPVCGLCKESESSFEDEAVKKLRVCILYGTDDEDEIVDSNKAAEKKFKQAGAKVSVNAYDGGHAYPSDEDATLTQALKFVLGK